MRADGFGRPPVPIGRDAVVTDITVHGYRMLPPFVEYVTKNEAQRRRARAAELEKPPAPCPHCGEPRARADES